MSADPAFYVDSSALVKLVVDEEESAALQSFLDRAGTLYASALARTEVPRAARRSREPRSPARAHLVVDELDLVELDEELLFDAATVGDAGLRTLDAIHLATARALRDDLDAVVTYDVRLATAAEAEGFRVESPR